MATWTAANYAHLKDAAEALHVRAPNLLAVLYAESGLEPTADNGIAKGLNQITWTNANGWLTKDQWAAIPTLGVDQQLPMVVRSFQRGAGSGREYEGATDLYQANFAPATLARGSSDATVLYRSKARGGSVGEDAAYRANIGLDTRHVGQIEVGDLRRYLIRATSTAGFQKHLVALGEGRPDLGELGGSSWLGDLVSLGLVGAVGYGGFRYWKTGRVW